MLFHRVTCFCRFYCLCLKNDKLLQSLNQKIYHGVFQMKKIILSLILLCLFTFSFAGCENFTDHNDGKCDFCFTSENVTRAGKFEACLDCIWEIGTSDY